MCRETFIAYRLKVNHLDRRLPEGAFTNAAASGLQDSGPRGAVLSLHARVHSVKSESWESPEFIQIWGPRSAVYLVPSEDVAVFTLGRLPRDANEVRTINKIATVVQGILAGGSLRKRELTRQLEKRGYGRIYWSASRTGGFHIRWDARDTVVHAVDPPDADPEACRIELARRFLHFLGPSTSRGLQKWAGISRHDAEETFSRLRAELAPVDIDGREGYCLRCDADNLANATPHRGVRLLPGDDPYLSRPALETLVPTRAYRARLQAAVPPGALVVDGHIAGTFRRNKWHLKIEPWSVTPSAETMLSVEREVARFPLAGDASDSIIEWLPPWRHCGDAR